ncbi:MAG: hypothetical protein ABJN65_01980 [Parasphingorhabdus sp.]
MNLQEFSKEEQKKIQKNLEESEARFAREKVDQLKIDHQKCIDRIEEYDEGGAKRSNLKRLKTQRDKKLAHD